MRNIVNLILLCGCAFSLSAREEYKQDFRKTAPLAAGRITPHTEGLCAVLWHLLVSHPLLQRNATKWESVL